MCVLKGLAFLLIVSCPASNKLCAQPFELDAYKEGFRGGVQWVKRTWYNPKPGTAEPDMSKPLASSGRINQLIEYNKEGKLRTVIDFRPGTAGVVSATKRYSYASGRPTKLVLENSKAGNISTLLWMYDARGREVKREFISGPASPILIGDHEVTVCTWNGATRKDVRRDKQGQVLEETIYTFNKAGKTIREDYPGSEPLYAKTLEYDLRGNLVKEVSLEAGEPRIVWTYENNEAGKPVRCAKQFFSRGLPTAEASITTYAYSPQGDLTAQKTLQADKATDDSAWQHTYDGKGSRVLTAHIKNGKPEAIEVLELRYY